jgi:hypothetical protein
VNQFAAPLTVRTRALRRHHAADHLGSPRYENRARAAAGTNIIGEGETNPPLVRLHVAGTGARHDRV